jgi:hypothetical protein
MKHEWYDEARKKGLAEVRLYQFNNGDFETPEEIKLFDGFMHHGIAISERSFDKWQKLSIRKEFWYISDVRFEAIYNMALDAYSYLL